MQEWTTWQFQWTMGDPHAPRNDLAKILSTHMAGMVPLATVGISFEAYISGGHVAALPEHITVRGNAITCDAGNDIGHGVCVLCCSYLPEHGTCPCNLHQHDHALSLCVCTIDPPARRARVCRICAHHFLTAQTIEIHNNGRYWTCTTQSGLVTFKCATAYLPRTFEQMLWYATSILADGSSGPRYATDGYSYTLEQFAAYYGPQYLTMWRRAFWRTYQINMMHENKILNRHNFESSFNMKRQVFDASRINWLHQLSGMNEYIPYYLWPHEPMGCDTMSTEGWLQVCAGHHFCVVTKLLDQYIAGLCEDAKFLNIIQQHRHSLRAIAYSCDPDNEELFTYELKQAALPHVYLHPNSMQRQTSAIHIAERLHALVDEWFPFGMGVPPTIDYHGCAGYPPHKWLARHVDGYNNALFFTNMHYETLCNAWAPGLEGMGNIRAAVIRLESLG